eukprot:GILI01031737.1.p1 GENE.GILI01031737.1~~GILI01031737.1.p1  ORF type:complete len:160 (-),score=24.28 GILI01031737.1:81-560(-)
MELSQAHQIASDVFIQHNLSYVFISKLVDRSAADQVLSERELGAASNSAQYSPAASASVDDWSVIPNANTTLIQFSFSKPSSTSPRPAVVVEMTLEFVAYNKSLNLWRYLVRVEGQRYSRLIEVSGDKAKVAGTEFSEKWLDKVYNQKQAAMASVLWRK